MIPFFRSPGAALAAAALLVTTATAQEVPEMNPTDDSRTAIFDARRADWRNGAVVYQVIVDRFAPPADLDAKRDLYPAPKRLREWSEKPRRGTFNEQAQVWSHEIDFWGGDLDSLRSRLDYIHELGVDVLYLNPIHLAFTNHKYDAQDYFEVSPEYGTREDVAELAAASHELGMRFMLDGVFNHMGRTSPWFQEARENPDSPWREWYYFGDQYTRGYRAWVNVPNLPELNLESQTVRDRLWNDPDSVIRGYLAEGVDGWRLDVAFDIGPEYLAELTAAAHKEKPGSLIIGEIWNYPEEWVSSIDGIMNMTARELILNTVRGDISASLAGKHFERMVDDTDDDYLLKSWIIIDNHDTVRLATALEKPWQQRMAQALLFTLPGSPVLYYGTELGMTGGHDPEMRAPMRWDLVTEDNEQLAFTKNLIALRKEAPSLSIGDFRLLDSDHLLAFIRRTDNVREMALVIANTSGETVTDVLMLRDSKIMSFTTFEDALSDRRVTTTSATLDLEVAPHTIHIFRPIIGEGPDYTPYKRIR